MVVDNNKIADYTFPTDIFSVNDTSSLLDVGLYDTDTNALITTIDDGEEILASTLLDQNLTIAAFVPEDSLLFEQVGSVSLDLNDSQVTQTENVEPYALFGDNSGNFFADDLSLDENNTIAFKLYSQDNLGGKSLGTVRRNFTITDDVSGSLDIDEPLNSSPTYTATHVFSSDDVIGKFDGTTQGDLETSDTPIIDFNAVPKSSKEGINLYPINSEFGFNVTDFEGAEQKDFVLDPEYEEGWAGNLTGTNGNLGLVVSDAPTATFKTPHLRGTWLGGIGGNSVKASTEHYATMQNVLSDQYFPDDPDAVYPLDNNLIVVGGEFAGQAVSDVVTQLELTGEDRNGDGLYSILDVLAPNENSVSEDIAVSNDYSVTVKDDGKLLYRWGNLVKRPTDIRVRTELPLPEEWGTGLYQVSQAELLVRHTISNNPNDQIRPEDYENEAATGRLPNYTISEDGQWLSTEDFYAGDGTFLPAGTVLKDPAVVENSLGSILNDTGALSSDLEQGFTKAWYTTQDREPFEAVLAEDTYEVGPRWRLKSNKYGQDLPGVEIPFDPSQPPPPTKDEIKYEVGADTQTVINLLDWSDPNLSPLRLSSGWQHSAGEVSENGLALSDNFDIAFYVKGDQKPLTLYDTELVMSYEEVPVFGSGEDITGMDNDDILVGEGGNTFEGKTGDDLFVLSYEATEISASTIVDFNIEEDAIGLINQGVTIDNFSDSITQQLNSEGDLNLSLNGNALATLTGVGTELTPDRFYLA